MRDESGVEGSSDLHRSYQAWCSRKGARPESNTLLSRYLVASGFNKKKTKVRSSFIGLRLRKR